MTPQSRPVPKWIYLAGPMTGIVDFNYPAFNQAAEQLRAKGFQVENPAENPQPACNSWNGYMRLGLRQMLKCDAVVFLPGWWQSKGARLELDVASRLSMPVFTLEELL
ncbi:MAG: DUF4406 domain-containing protein [Methylomicrobium sp.]|nr:DUF4406 domain-containing protein [Methylomicrobium sp.]